MTLVDPKRSFKPQIGIDRTVLCDQFTCFVLFCGSTALSDGPLLQNFGGQTSFLAAHLDLRNKKASSLDTLSTVFHANQIPRRSSECKLLTQ
jgi:hypothetical protein